MEITCPSDLRISVRKLKGKTVGDVFRGVGARKGGRGRSQARGANKAARLDPLLEFAHVETLDASVYRWENGKPTSWQDVLTGDRLCVLLKAREKTLGKIYSFRAQCGVVGCRARIPWDLDLDELKTFKLSEESKQHFLSNEPFEFTLPGRVLALYHLELGKDEGRVPRDVDPICGSVLSRIDQIGDETDFNKVREIVEDMDLDVLDGLRADMEANDCGVETSFEVECQECEAETTIELPFDKTFFMPKTGARSL